MIEWKEKEPGIKKSKVGYFTLTIIGPLGAKQDYVWSVGTSDTDFQHGSNTTELNAKTSAEAALYSICTLTIDRLK